MGLGTWTVSAAGREFVKVEAELDEFAEDPNAPEPIEPIEPTLLT
jgi:hypothetical protein